MTKLQAQKDYLEAEEHGDLERMRAISIQYGSTLAKSTPKTPAPCKYNNKTTNFVMMHLRNFERQCFVVLENILDS